EPPLGMIGGALAVKAPDLARQDAIGEFLALAPPAIPNGAQVAVSASLGPGQFGRQQSRHAEQPRLQCQGRTSRRAPAAAVFREALHRPNIVFITQSAKDAFPQRLLPA